MRPRSFAGKLLLALPLISITSWSGNATVKRMNMNNTGYGPTKQDFLTGSMDESIMDTLDTGDILFFSRDLTALQPLPALYTWLLRQSSFYKSRFDHCGLIYVDRLGNRFIVEETFDKIQVRPYSARILSSLSTEILVLPLEMNRTPEFRRKAQECIKQFENRPSRISIRHLFLAILSVLPLEKKENDTKTKCSVYPSASFILEAYEAMGLISMSNQKDSLKLNTVTPQQLLPKRKVWSLESSTSQIQFKSDVAAEFQPLIIVRSK